MDIIDEIRMRMANLDDPPWEYEEHEDVVGPPWLIYSAYGECAWTDCQWVAQWVAAARSDIPYLLRIAEAARHVWETIPAEFDGPAAQKHAEALSDMRRAIQEPERR